MYVLQFNVYELVFGLNVCAYSFAYMYINVENVKYVCMYMPANKLPIPKQHQFTNSPHNYLFHNNILNILFESDKTYKYKI